MKCVFEHAELQMFDLKLLQIWVIFTHLELWVVVARHNYKWVKNDIFNLAPQVLKWSSMKMVSSWLPSKELIK